MVYSVKQAAEATGKTKPTILRAIQKGKISAKKDEHGEWEIDPPELHRVYEPVAAGTSTGTDTSVAAALREIELLREMLSDKDRQIDGLTRRLEDVDEERRTTLRQLTALLTDQRAKAPEVMVTPPPTSAAIITPPPPAAAAPTRTDVAVVNEQLVTQPTAKEAGWFRRMIGGQ